MFVAETRFYRATHDNVHLEDVTWAFLSARVSADAGRDETWTLDAELTIEGWEYFDPYLDWVAPVLTVWYPDGTVRRGQLGLYLVLDSDEDRSETYGTVTLEARDPLYLLGIQAFEEHVYAPAGKGKLRTIREILDGAVLTEGSGGKPRYVIHGNEKDFRREAEWPRNTLRLDLCNEIAEGAGILPLWTTQRGVVLSRDRGTGKLKDRQVARTFLANVPDDVEIGARATRRHEAFGHVVGPIRTTPKSRDMTNEVVIVGEVPWDPPREKRHRADHPDNTRSDRRERRKERRREQEQIQNRRRRHRRWVHRHPLLDDDATAKQVARALLDELSTQNTIVRFSSMPDPQPEYVREVVALGIWDAHKRRIAFGKYAVHSVIWDLTNTSAVMTIEAGKVQNADSITEGGD